MSVIMFLGPPGAGKGAQCAQLAPLGWRVISTGQLLRSAAQAEDARGMQLRQSLSSGALVPDELVVDLVRGCVAEAPGVHWILDGFPRTQSQLNLLEVLGLLPQHVFVLCAPDALIVERLAGRLVDLESGRVYHEIYHPPRSPGIDDDSGRPLHRREDDRPEVILARLASYHKHTAEMLTALEQMQAHTPIGITYLDARDSLERIHVLIRAALGE